MVPRRRGVAGGRGSARLRSGTLGAVPTYYDGSVRLASESWSSLRRRRASPPVPARSAEVRGETFRNALEQAEQQCSALRPPTVDYDSRALNLYYGVSQAGRAVAAAATGLGHDEWTLQGHGLKAPNLAAVGADVSTLIVKPDKKACVSFTRLSRVLRSPPPESITFRELWPLMYETTLQAPLSPFASGSAGRQTSTFAPSVPRNPWQSVVSSLCPPRHRPIAPSPSQTSTRGTAPSAAK
jgi:hypothetical protein